MSMNLCKVWGFYAMAQPTQFIAVYRMEEEERWLNI
jgi:hypothetical protein